MYSIYTAFTYMYSYIPYILYISVYFICVNKYLSINIFFEFVAGVYPLYINSQITYFKTLYVSHFINFLFLSILSKKV